MGIFFEELTKVLQSDVIINDFEYMFSFDGEEEELFDLGRNVALVLGCMY